MQFNNTSNKSTTTSFTRCLGIYHLIARPTGNTYATYISVIVILSIFSVLSAFGNGLIIFAYMKQKSLQRTNTLLLACLALLDFISAVLLEPFYVVRLLSEIFGFTSCVYILLVRRMLEFLRPVSFMTLALITIERYFALFKAITHRRMVTKQRLLHAILLIWFAWFAVICIRSVFPKITSAFYTFSTFVAFSLLVGNLIMYFKIGKLARLHSRPTRVSTAPTSLNVRYGNSRSIDPGSTNPGLILSKAEESVNDILRNTLSIEASEKTLNNEINCNSQPQARATNTRDDTKIEAKYGNEITAKKCKDHTQIDHNNSNILNTSVSDTTKGIEEEMDGKRFVKSTEKTKLAQNTVSQKKDIETTDRAKTNNVSLTNNRSSTVKAMVETRERNATWTVFYIVAILTICYLPISALLLYLSFNKEPNATVLFIYLPIADTIALFNALVNPFVYCLKNKKMRTAVKSVLKQTRHNV